MPLILCVGFFIGLFTVEGACYLAGAAAKERELDRYYATEHPRRLTSDLYLDMLG